MYEVLDKLTKIQGDLVGIIISVAATAIVSLLTLFVNFLTKILVECNEYNKEQLEKMKKFYPEFKAKIVYLALLIKELDKNPLYSTISQMYGDYELCTKDEIQYRNNHKENLNNIDLFITESKKWVKNMATLNDFFENADIPMVPLYHPLLKHRVRKMLECLQYHSFLVFQYINNKISKDVFLDEINLLYANKKNTISNDCLQKYTKLLYKWYLKY